MCYYTITLKVVRIRSKKIRESSDIQPIIEWMEIRRQIWKWDEQATGMDAERLVKIPRDNIPAGRRFLGHPKRRWSDVIPY